MKTFVLMMLMVGLVVSPVWAAPKQDTIHQDILNQIEVLQGDNASQTTTLQNAINGIPTTDLTPVLNAVTAGEANVLANDNLNTQSILDAIANVGPPAPPIPCNAPLGVRFVHTADTVCDALSGTTFSKEPTTVAVQNSGEATAFCDAKAPAGDWQLPSIQEVAILFTANDFSNSLTVANYEEWTLNGIGFPVAAIPPSLPFQNWLRNSATFTGLATGGSQVQTWKALVFSGSILNSNLLKFFSSGTPDTSNITGSSNVCVLK